MSVQALSAAFAVRGLSPSEKLVLLALANYANENLQCWPSQDRLAEDTELSPRTVWAALKGLEERGMLRRESRKRADGTRSSDLFALALSAPNPVANIAKSTRKFCESQSQSLQDPVATVATHTTFEPPEEPKSEAIASARNGPDDEAWREGVVVLVSQGGMTVPAAKSFIGGLLKQNRIEARSLLGAIGECKANSTHDPKSYLAAAARARGRGRDTGPAKRVSFV